MLENPVIRGFNADPSFCRVGEDYYIATSTFEWYPGVQIHHSRDLVNWTAGLATPATGKPAGHAGQPGQLRDLGAVSVAMPTGGSGWSIPT